MKPLYRVMMGLTGVIGLLLTGACSEFLAIDPPKNQLVAGHIFADEALAEGAVLGIYYEMNTGRTNHFSSGGSGSITNLLGIAADELSFNRDEAARRAFADVNLLPATPGVANIWGSAYKTVFRANEVLEGLESAENMLPDKIKQLRGEALFVRAFCYFYLVNLYGPVPLALTTDYRVTRSLAREKEEVVYARIADDLVMASDLLPVDYSHAHHERTRPSRWAAQALLARVYLYQGKWRQADEASSRCLDQRELFSLHDDPALVFLKNSSEAIWQILPVNTLYDTYEGFEAIPAPGTTLAPVYSMSDQWLAQVEPGDARKEAWVGKLSLQNGARQYTYPHKFRVRTKTAATANKEFSMVLRIAEQYLIRAEAKARLGAVSEALDALNILREARGLEPRAVSGASEVLEAIERERFMELFYEWGHRWFDLKRWGKSAQLLAVSKPGWKAHSLLLPIPQGELDVNPMLTQNEGY